MRMFLVAGNPISHSMSPVMHNAAFRELGLDDCTYQSMELDKESLPSLISLLREGKVMGANLTTPLKEAVIPYLDKLSQDATSCGSVNTLIPNGDILIGDTTDGEGCVKALSSKGINLMRKRVLVIGAGGAAKAITHSIAKRGPKKLYIVNRTVDRAERLAETLKAYDNISPRGWKGLDHCLERSNIVINCTTLGMSGSNGEVPISMDKLDSSKVVMDIVYEPLRTRLLKEAEDAGSLTIDGLDMLVHQGAISFERWTGLKPPLDVMRSAIEDKLMVIPNGRSTGINRVHG